MKKTADNFKLLIIISIITAVFIFAGYVYAGTLSCTVRSTTCNPGETAVFNIQDTANSQAEVPSQSNYTNLVCCGNVSGISNACAGTFETVLRLSGATNAHVEQNNPTTTNYNGNDVCLQLTSGGSLSVGYNDSNCSGYDTIVASISSTTNAHVGSSGAYTRKVCATAENQSVSCSTALTATDFGALSGLSISTASPNATTSMTCDYALGCSLSVNDVGGNLEGSGNAPGLATTSPAYVIPSPNAALSASTTLISGIEGYGVQAATTTDGSGSVFTIHPRYLLTGNNVGGLATTTFTMASSSGTFTERIMQVTHKATMGGATPVGSYTDTITYSCVGN